MDCTRHLHASVQGSTRRASVLREASEKEAAKAANPPLPLLQRPRRTSSWSRLQCGKGVGACGADWAGQGSGAAAAAMVAVAAGASESHPGRWRRRGQESRDRGSAVASRGCCCCRRDCCFRGQQQLSCCCCCSLRSCKSAIHHICKAAPSLK